MRRKEKIRNTVKLKKKVVNREIKKIKEEKKKEKKNGRNKSR